MVIVSILAMLGSLYFSEVRIYTPCEMCWYQRVLMYPMVVITIIGTAFKDKLLGYYTIIFSSVGALIALYHYLAQKVNFVGEEMSCSGTVTCTVQYINWLGFITIPLLSFVAFVMILVLSILYIKTVRKKREENNGE